MKKTRLAVAVLMLLLLCGCTTTHSLGEWNLIDFARRQDHISDHLGEPKPVATFPYNGRSCEIVTRVLPPHSIWKTKARETLAQDEPVTFWGVVDPDGPDPFWCQAPVTYVAGVGAVALITSATDKTSGVFRDEVALYEPDTKPEKESDFPSFKGTGWRSFAHFGRIAGDRAVFFRQLYSRSPDDFDTSFIIVADSGKVRRFTDVAAIAVKHDGAWHKLPVESSWDDRPVVLPEGAICFFAREGNGPVKSYLLGADLRLADDVTGFQLASGELGGASFVLTRPVADYPKFLEVERPDGTFRIPPGSLGVVPALDPSTRKVVMWLVPYITDDGIGWGWATGDFGRLSGPIWREARFAASRTTYRPVMERPKIVYGSTSTTYMGGGVHGFTEVLLVQGTDGQWEVVLPASPPLPPFADARLRRSSAEAAFKDSEARAAPVVKGMEAELKGQRDALWRSLQPPPARKPDPATSDWDYFWHGTPSLSTSATPGYMPSSSGSSYRPSVSARDPWQDARDKAYRDVMNRYDIRHSYK